MARLRIIYASTSGHTEYVVERLEAFLRGKGADIERLRVENAQPEHLSGCDLLILASGTWNTGSIEGQLNPHMHAFVHGRAKDVDLNKRAVAVIALGDARYRYTARAGEHLKHFVTSHGGVLVDSLKIVNDPYGQESAVEAWGAKIFTSVSSKQ